LSIIGNFFWGGQGFSGSAQNIEFNIEGNGSVPVLRASLFDGEGNTQERDINLGERIGNNDGNFSYSGMLLLHLLSKSSTNTIHQE
jgi:hypothetical protein